MRTYIVRLDAEGTDFGVYALNAVGPYGTPLVFRGTFEACVAWRRGL